MSNVINLKFNEFKIFFSRETLIFLGFIFCLIKFNNDDGSVNMLVLSFYPIRFIIWCIQKF